MHPSNKQAPTLHSLDGLAPDSLSEHIPRTLPDINVGSPKLMDTLHRHKPLNCAKVIGLLVLKIIAEHDEIVWYQMYKHSIIKAYICFTNQTKEMISSRSMSIAACAKVKVKQ